MVTSYFGCLYLGLGVLLGIRGIYLGERLLKHVDRQYPEEAEIIRSHQWQMYPWSVGQRTLRVLIEKKSSNDHVLAYWARRVKRGWTYFKAWFIFALIMSFIQVLFILVK
ncbi:MAG: hypothetical protein OEW48_13875 [Phycisphaerae bacterium]|nr:hypothetical protein [Phycisphaerae bacterium]